MNTVVVGVGLKWLSIQMETRNHQHVEEIRSAISAAGYKIISTKNVM